MDALDALPDPGAFNQEEFAAAHTRLRETPELLTGRDLAIFRTFGNKDLARKALKARADALMPPPPQNDSEKEEFRRATPTGTTITEATLTAIVKGMTPVWKEREAALVARISTLETELRQVRDEVKQVRDDMRLFKSAAAKAFMGANTASLTRELFAEDGGDERH